MNKRVYGVIGISSIMGNWNADFTGYPKTISTGEVFGSDKALKMPMKKYWEDKGEKVLSLKSLIIDDSKKGENKIRPRSLKERYEQLFEVNDLKSEKDGKVVLKNLFSAIDVRNFGTTFAESGFNIGITGAVQVGQGFNKYEYTEAQEQQILSPYIDGKSKEKKGEEASATTIGTKIVSNEAHYFYPFTINPAEYNKYIEMGVSDGYTEEDYAKFKEVALVSATAFNTNAKIGCENEFAVFVETEAEFYLPNLTEYITFEKENENINTITLGFDKMLNEFSERISNIEIYYNPYKTKIVTDIKKAKYFNIYTRSEV